MRTELSLSDGVARPERCRSAPFRRLIALAATGLMVSACAASKGASDYQSYAGAPNSQIAGATPPKPDLEADGLPAQLPPPRRVNPKPIDPSEPFSPNYGPPPANAPMDPGRDPAPLYRADADRFPSLRRAEPAVPSLSPAEVDAVIARAIMAHEQRYP